LVGTFALPPGAAFHRSRAEDIVSALEADGSEVATGALKLLKKMSPTSVKVTLVQLEKGAKMDLRKTLDMELAMSREFMSQHEFFEGVRSILVDKDGKAVWDPSTLPGVSDEAVQKYFS